MEQKRAELWALLRHHGKSHEGDGDFGDVSYTPPCPGVPKPSRVGLWKASGAGGARPGTAARGQTPPPPDQRPCDPRAVSTAARGRPVGKRREGEGNRGMHSGVGRSLGIL